jgi:uncharacterized protein YndB with AHSA1/START domain
MGVKKDSSGRRSVEVQIEVPGTPEEVWQAIATGPGVSSWFVPVDIEEGKDGEPARIVSHFGPGMDAVATATVWDPPRRFAAESRDLGPNAPALATEWIVEARDGGTCIVRVVHSLFAGSDDWDDQLSSVESGWPAFFQILRLYMTHFRGWPCRGFRVMGEAPPPEPQAWTALVGPLGLTGAAAGQRWNADPGAPPMGGIVERLGEGKHPHQILLRLDDPAPGIAFLFAHTMGAQVLLIASFYLYGDTAAAVAARDEPMWQAWINHRLGLASHSGCLT